MNHVTHCNLSPRLLKVIRIVRPIATLRANPSTIESRAVRSRVLRNNPSKAKPGRKKAAIMLGKMNQVLMLAGIARVTSGKTAMGNNHNSWCCDRTIVGGFGLLENETC